ncbi:acetolactate synthase, large subunit, biosynthetic type [archaeon D22]|nr:acetolactate synthase, large subunit, biosynthetic type [archaeon D22]
MVKEMKGTDATIQSMIKNGTDVTFGYPGGQVIPLFDTYLDYQDKIRNVLVRHEQGAAHAAEGYAKASGKVGVCISTSGPGATNMVTGIMDAYMDNIPILALGGQVPSKLIGNDAFQESDMIGITMPITKHNFQIRNANDIMPTMHKAYHIAQTGRPGPVYVDLTKDAQVSPVTSKKTDFILKGFNPTIKGNPVQIKKASKMLLEAERPLILAGGGVMAANASKELLKLVEMTNTPVATTMMGKGIIDENHPLCVGLVGMHGKKVANYASINADLIIAIGCRFSDRITGDLSSYAERAKVIHIDVDPAEIGKNVEVDLPIVGNAKSVLEDIIKVTKVISQKEDSIWQQKIKQYVKECDCNPNRDSVPIDPVRVIKELNKVLKKEDIVTTGVGQHQMFAMHFLKMKSPRTFISSGGAGTMGFGLPAAVGAKVARPNSQVFDIDGDGSFQMTMQELGTCKEDQIKVNPIIFRNNYLGMVRQWLELFFDRRYSQVNLPNHPDFVKICEAYGLGGEVITRPTEIAEGLKRQIKADETYLLDINIKQESNILPMLPPGGHLKDAFGGCMKGPGRFF